MAAGQRIVVGVDGSDASLDALRWAVRHAALTSGSVEAVIGWQFPYQYGVEFYGEDLNWDEVATATLRAAIADVAAELPEAAAVIITQQVRQGHPAEVLVQASAGADMLVVGSHGHGGFLGMLIGSVTKHVTAHAQCPVLVVRHPRRPGHPGHPSAKDSR
jgi:nucleotide-binding universal stress UspA family protein